LRDVRRVHREGALAEHREDRGLEEGRRAPREEIGRASCREKGTSRCKPNPSRRKMAPTASRRATKRARTRDAPSDTTGTTADMSFRLPHLSRHVFLSLSRMSGTCICVFCQAEGAIRVFRVTGVQTCALPIYLRDVRRAHLPGALAEHREDRGLQEGRRAPRE